MKDTEDLLVRPSSTLKLSEYDPDNTLGRNQDDLESEFAKLHLLMSDLQVQALRRKGKINSCCSSRHGYIRKGRNNKARNKRL